MCVCVCVFVCVYLVTNSKGQAILVHLLTDSTDSVSLSSDPVWPAFAAVAKLCHLVTLLSLSSFLTWLGKEHFFGQDARCCCLIGTKDSFLVLGKKNHYHQQHLENRKFETLLM